ncbi:MAG: 50S ribosomal protein L2 [Verrucomicrobiota bacterium]|jgi:large subunit ribosomal protein L2|nr:50S ribosomal protein L2 [Verrucomicrobiota bacterium]
MAVKTFKPLTPGRRFQAVADFSNLTKKKPEKKLLTTKKKTGGRNCYGRITARAIGGGHKQKIRTVDFRRNKTGIEAEVVALEYDPMRSARLALLQYTDGEKRYIVAPLGLEVGGKVMSGPEAPTVIGNAMPLENIPVGSSVHSIELMPGRGGQIARTAGSFATLMSCDSKYAQIKMPSGEIRRIHSKCKATIGQVGNTDHENIIIGTAGRNRHRGRRPLTRGVCRNPVDHPNGGGNGRSKGGGGRQHLVSPWGLLCKGYKTRNKHKTSNKFILVRRDGRPNKLK